MTIIILIITCAISILAFSNQELMRKLIFNPYMVTRHKEWWRFVSSGFIHADWLHLFVNMFVLYSFGQMVEAYYSQVFDEKGLYYYAVLYIGGIVIAITPSYAANKENMAYNSLGASGAVSAVVFAGILFQPLGGIGFMFLPGLDIPAFIFGFLYLAYSWYMDKKGDAHVNHNAHFWGAIFGVLFTILLKPKIAVYFINQIISFGSN